jgi:hypothetical protein
MGITRQQVSNAPHTRDRANPYRLQLDWRWHESAGVAVARKGGVPKDKVLKAMPLDQVLALLRKRYQRVGRSHRRGAGIFGRPVAGHTTETEGLD